MKALALCLLLGAPGAAAPPEGVTVVFPSGGQIRGVLLSDDGRELSLEVDGGTVEFARDAVAEVRREPNAHAEFKGREARADPKDAGALWTLAQWASENGLPGWARLSAERALAADPEHAGARAFLGYQHADGAWRRGEDLMRAKGYVRHGGRWMTFSEREGALDAEAREAALAKAAALEARRARAWTDELYRLEARRRPESVFVNVSVTFLRRPFHDRLSLPRMGPEADHAWRPEPFRFGEAALGIPAVDPVGAHAGDDPLR